MNHKKFLLILNQLLSQKAISIAAFGLHLCVEKTENEGIWKLTIRLFKGGNEIPEIIKECVSPTGAFKWQKMGPHLTLDPQTKAIFLVEEVPAPQEYIPFKTLVHNFVQVATEWDEMLIDL